MMVESCLYLARDRRLIGWHRVGITGRHEPVGRDRERSPGRSVGSAMIRPRLAPMYWGRAEALPGVRRGKSLWAVRFQGDQGRFWYICIAQRCYLGAVRAQLWDVMEGRDLRPEDGCEKMRRRVSNHAVGSSMWVSSEIRVKRAQWNERSIFRHARHVCSAWFSWVSRLTSHHLVDWLRPPATSEVAAANRFDLSPIYSVFRYSRPQGPRVLIFITGRMRTAMLGQDRP